MNFREIIDVTANKWKTDADVADDDLLSVRYVSYYLVTGSSQDGWLV